MNAQAQVNMIWCGNKEAGNAEITEINAECLSEGPRFWSPEVGELKCLGFKMSLAEGDVSTLFTSLNGEFTETMRISFKTKTTIQLVQFYDVIVQFPNGDTFLSDKVYKVRNK